MSGIAPTASRVATLVALSAALMAAPARADTTAPPDRVDRIGATPVVAAPVQLPPDRADGLGSARFPTVQTPTVIVRTAPGDGFSWPAAVVGAASALGVSLLAAAALMARGRRRAPVPS